MKLGFLFSPLFWGVVLILWGCSIVLNMIFNLNIPVFKILVALVIIFIGIQMLFGWKWDSRYYARNDENNVIFGQSSVEVTPSTKEYNIIFSKGEVNITEPNPAWINAKVEVNTVFGYGIIRINPDIPVKIVTSAAFGHVSTPDNYQTAMGDHVYQTPALQENQPYLLIKADVVFGNLEVVHERRAESL